MKNLFDRLSALVIGVLIGVLAALYLLEAGKGPWLNENTLPNWIQAVASILTILAMAWIANNEQRKRDKASQEIGQHVARSAQSKLITIGARLRPHIPQPMGRGAPFEEDFSHFAQSLDRPLSAIATAQQSEWPTHDDLAKLVALSPSGTAKVTDLLARARWMLENAVEASLQPHTDDATFSKKRDHLHQYVGKAVQALVETNALLAEMLGQEPSDDVLFHVVDGKPTSIRRSEWEAAQQPWWKKAISKRW